MSTAVAPRNGLPATTPANEKVVTYMPLGGKAAVELTFGMVRKFLCTPTKSGKQPSDAEVVKFMMLCRARELDPWVGDAYLIGYDSQNGPQFSLITAVQALLKRAEISPQFDGIESGIVVQTGSGIEHRDGALALEGESIVGGWAKIYRKDRKIPYSAVVKFQTFNTGRSQWAKDPAGMIVKCAKAAALREAFPTQLAGLYTDDEMGEISRERSDKRSGGGSQIAASSLNDLVGSAEPAWPAQSHVEDSEDSQAPAIDPTVSDDGFADFASQLEEVDSILAIDNAVKAACEVEGRNDADRAEFTKIGEARKTAIRSKRGSRS